ncbi:MAG: flagellar biosynthesis protein FliQ [Planctomycetes bacterium]|nr:flagellar biosynthesis protein FliQ [Planctomycetota bacterium]
MEPDLALDLGRQALMMMMMISLPLLGVALVVGVLVSIIQAVTQIQEMTLTFVPKIIVMALAAALMMPYLLQLMMEYATKMFGSMPIP